jgi:gliding motility-associated-like protein
MKHFLLPFYFFSFFFLFVTKSSNAQLTFNNGLTAQQLAQTLVGTGVNITNATINCPSNAIGSFTGTSSIGMTNGIILTNGSTSIVSPNTNVSNATVCNNSPGDPQLDALAGSGNSTYDACALEFDIVPLCDTLRFNYVFGSEEYPEYVGRNVNDNFAFFISGPGITGQPNIAVLPNGTDVTIDNVNDHTNSQYYVTNTGSSIEYDGYTVVLTAWAAVQPCQTYHLKIVIADVGDCLYDSGVFIKAGSLQCHPAKSITAVQNAIEGCQNGSFRFCREDSTAALTFNYTIAGTASNGTDYNSISNSIVIPAGQGCFTLPIVALADGITEGTETIKLIYQAGVCPTMDTATITISDPPTVNAGHDTTLCTGGTVTIGAPPVTGTTYSWTPATGLNNATISNPSVTLTNTTSTPATTSYVVTATTNGCTAKDTVKVKVYSMPIVNAGTDITICSGTATLFGHVSVGASTGMWSGGLGVFNPNSTTLNSIYTPSAAEVDAGTITLKLTSTGLGPCPSKTDSVVILISPQAIVNAGPDQTICIGNTVTLAGNVSGSTTSGIWSGGAGTYTPNDTTLNAVYTPTAAEATAGTVTLTLTSNAPSSSCTPSTDLMTITINHLPTANAGSGQYVCSGSAITLSGSIGGTATSGTWSGGTGRYVPDSTALHAIYTPSPAEYAADSVILTLTTNDPVGPCTFSSSSVTFHFYPLPSIDFSADSSAGCPIHCTTFNNLTTISGGNTITNWNWNFGDGSAASSVITPSHCFSVSGLYDIKLTATSNHGCVDSLTKSHLVEVYNFPVAEFSFSPNPATVLDPTITFNNQSSSDVNYWRWNFGDTTNLFSYTSNPLHGYPQDISGTYLVTLIVHNVNGCYDTVAHPIIINPEFSFYVPNSFSPNDDGINDFFVPTGEGITKFDLWIFDRWGNMIFHTKELSDHWDGKANGGKNTAQIDVFVWKVALTDVFNKSFDYIGTVSIIR